MNAKIVFPELSYRITGLCFKTQKDLGRFCRECQYADYLEGLFVKENISYQREFVLTKLCSDSPQGNRVDFYIESKILFDCKAKSYITKEDYFQMQRYLKAAKAHLGLIVNFRSYHIKPKRVLNNDFLDKKFE